MGDRVGWEVKPLPAPASRTTLWHKRNAPAAPTSANPHKVHCCQKCQQPIGSVGHSQFKGQIYCPYVPDQLPKDEWLALQRAEYAEKKEAQHGRVDSACVRPTLLHWTVLRCTNLASLQAISALFLISLSRTKNDFCTDVVNRFHLQSPVVNWFCSVSIPLSRCKK